MKLNCNIVEKAEVKKPVLNRYERAMKQLEEDSKITNDSFIVIKYKENGVWNSTKVWFKNKQDWKHSSVLIVISKRHNKDIELYEDILKYASDYDRVVINNLVGNDTVYVDEDTIFKVGV